MSPDEVRQVTDSIRALVDQVDSGQVYATGDERAYLVGAADALDQVGTRIAVH